MIAETWVAKRKSGNLNEEFEAKRRQVGKPKVPHLPCFSSSKRTRGASISARSSSSGKENEESAGKISKLEMNLGEQGAINHGKHNGLNAGVWEFLKFSAKKFVMKS